jgi:hypothetical protein
MTHNIKVQQLTSPQSGAPVANQFEIETPKGLYFQSYKSIIAFKDNNGKIKLDQYYWDYSRTTSRYLNRFLNMTSKEVKLLIKEGIIKLTNLN